MSLRSDACRRLVSRALALSLLALPACTYEQAGPPELHFEFFKSHAPVDNTVTVCSGYGCTFQTQFTFSESDIRQIAQIMDGARGEDTPAAEREALATAIAWIERRAGKATGTDTDRAGLDFLGAGVKSQQDCVDEATNTTSYMLVMERYALLRHHKVIRPVAKGNMIMGRWPHWGAIIEETPSGKKFAVDSFFEANGKPPVIMAANKWYIDEDNPTVFTLPTADPAPKRLARRTPDSRDAAAPATGQIAKDTSGLAGRGSLNRLFETVTRSPEARPSAFGRAN